jgi:hypothetical protein
MFNFWTFTRNHWQGLCSGMMSWQVAAQGLLVIPSLPARDTAR